MIIEGDPGIGKTTLWLDAVGNGAASVVSGCWSRAAVAESVLAYAALADLLSAVDELEWADWPVLQKHGLEAALLRRLDDARATDVRAVAAAFVAVIDRLAAQRPVVVAIDDLQWLDTSSANVLAYAARRLPKGAALLCATRTEDAVSRDSRPVPDAVRRIRLRPLTVGDYDRF